jgi:hypothetical protein
MRAMNYPEELDLSRYSAGVGKYSLYGVLVHSGYSCHSGHYFSFVKAGNGFWYEMNDSSVSQASLGRVLNHPCAYMLFYIQKTEFRVVKSPASQVRVPQAAEPKTKVVETEIEARVTDTGSESSDVRPNTEEQEASLVVEDSNVTLPRKRLGHCLHKVSLKRICRSSASASVLLPRTPVEMLGFVKDEYDRQLDAGRIRKLKKPKQQIPSSWWDSVRF